MQTSVAANSKAATINSFNLTHVWQIFEKVNDKMKDVNYNLYQNTNTVLLIETTFYKQNRVHFLFLLQNRDFCVACDVPWVW